MMRGMAGKRQFTLRFLFLELLWTGIALGFLRAIFLNYGPTDIRAPCFLGAISAIGAAVGGFAGNMAIGAAAGFMLALAAVLTVKIL